MPEIKGVLESDIKKKDKVKIGMEYQHQFPQAQNPDDLDSDLEVKNKSPDSHTTGDDSSPPGKDDDLESSNQPKLSKLRLRFDQQVENNRSAKAAKKRKHAESAKTAKASNKQNNHLLDSSDESTQRQEDDQPVHDQEDDHTDASTGNTGANAVMPA